MLILSIDTSTPSGSVSLSRNLELLSSIPSTGSDPYSSSLPRHIAALLAEHSITHSAIDLYAVISGPGSFSGLRVGLTAVKAWSEVFSKPIVPLSGLEVIAALAHSSAPLIAPCFDARRGQLYAALFEQTPSGLRRLLDDSALDPAEFFSSIESLSASRPIHFASTTPAIVQPMLSSSPLSASTLEPIVPLLAPRTALLALARFHRGEFTDALHLDAHYVRRTDAEVQWQPR